MTMSMPRRVRTTTIRFAGTRPTVLEYRKALESLPDDARVEVTTSSGDQRDQRDPGSTTITVREEF